MRTAVASFCIGLLALAASCAPSTRNDDDGGTEPPCVTGERRCSGQALEVCQDGAFRPEETCAMACDPTLGCVACVPGRGVCDQGNAMICNTSGTGYETRVCDPVQGMVCDESAGDCRGACSPAQLGTSYTGCEYYPTVTANVVSNLFDFAITVSNTGAATAQITIDGANAATRPPISVEPGQVAVVRLPWTEALSAPWGLYPGDAYRVRSTQPVTVYEFSPLDYYTPTAGNSYTNDASLLLPAHRLGTDYVVATYPGGFFAVTALRENTTVTIISTADYQAQNGAPALVAGQPVSLTMQIGDVLHVGGGSDLTGTRISSTQPIQVIGGHLCTYVPLDVGACDHLEESMFPIETLGRSYAVTNPAVPPLPNGKEQVIRIVATENDTTLTFDPPQAGVATTLATAGQYVSMERHLGDFVVSSNKKILVAQYMEGQGAGGDTGDPALTLAVATDQYRTDYLFHAPTNYEVNYVNITAPVGTTVTVDGQPVMVTQAIGSSGVGVVRYQLGLGVAGNHTATADQPFGVAVYGYGQYTSYWYPGGLDLKQILD